MGFVEEEDQQKGEANHYSSPVGTISSQSMGWYSAGPDSETGEKHKIAV